MPLELALLPAVESNYTPTARSRSGAVGMWQFMSATGKHYGLDQNVWFDERRHVMASTDAALDYLDKLHDIFGGDWELAIASYNAGEGTVGRARTLAESKGQKSDYWSLDLPTETEEYVPRLFALATLVRQPRRHGLDLAYIPNRPQLAEVETHRTLDLAAAAEKCGLDKKEFCKLNAAYLNSVTTAQSKHRILVPAHKAEELLAILDELPEINPELTHSHVIASTYKVKRGDTLSAIARRFNVSVSELRSTNNIKGSNIRVGQAITVRGGSAPKGPTTAAVTSSTKTRTTNTGVAKVYKVQGGDTLSSIARRFDISVAQLKSANEVDGALIKVGQTLTIDGTTGATGAATGAARSTVAQTPNRVYEVKSGDTLWSIARSHKVQVDALCQHNGLTTKAVLKPGQTLRIPQLREAAAPANHRNS